MSQKTLSDIAYTDIVEEYVVRRTWHPSQTTERIAPGWSVLRLTIAGTVEIFSWILSFGRQMIVIQPAKLRDEIEAEIRSMLAGYGAHPSIESLGSPAGDGTSKPSR